MIFFFSVLSLSLFSFSIASISIYIDILFVLGLGFVNMIRGRIESRSSISDQNLQCSQGICEAVSNPYSFDDYLQNVGEPKRIKEGSSRREQLHACPFSLPHDLHNLTSFTCKMDDSDCLKVYNINFQNQVSYKSLFILPAFLFWF